MTISMLAIMVLIAVVVALTTVTVVLKIQKSGLSLDNTLFILSALSNAVSEMEDIIMAKAKTMSEQDLTNYICEIIKNKIESDRNIPEILRKYISDMDMERFFDLIKRYLLPIVNKAYAQIEAKK